MKTTALNNQTLLDIAVQEYGTIEAMFDFAIANNKSIHGELEVGADYIVPQGKQNTEILNYYKSKLIKPSTAISEQNTQDIETPDGIGYMAIGSTFIVG